MSEGRWDVYVRDMLDCCARIEDYTAGLGRDELVHARALYDATLWNIAVLGEAANNVPDAVQQSHPEIPWADITGTRNRIVHGYGGIRDQIVWEIVSRDIPDLIPQLRALLAEAEGMTDAHGRREEP